MDYVLRLLVMLATNARIAVHFRYPFRAATWLPVSLLAVTLLPAHPALGNTGYLSRPDVRSFIEAVRDEHGLDIVEIERVLGDAQHQPTVVRLIGPERSKTVQPVRSYPAYRSKFLTTGRIAAGARYWEQHEADLQRAQTEYGVPAEVILGILGVETAFGQNTGSFRVIDALTTIAFDGPRRQDYFRQELTEFLLLAREIGVDLLAIKGSYAGAVGLPQFMPSSYRRYAVDFDNDGLVDLMGSPADAIGSIANYIRAAGWIAGEAPTAALRLPSGYESEFVTGLQRSHDVERLQQRGVKFLGSQLPKGSCSVIELPAPGKPSTYLAGFANFEAITSYNRSTFYANAVLELAQAIHKARVAQPPAVARDLTRLSSSEGATAL